MSPVFRGSLSTHRTLDPRISTTGDGEPVKNRSHVAAKKGLGSLLHNSWRYSHQKSYRHKCSTNAFTWEEILPEPHKAMQREISGSGYNTRAFGDATELVKTVAFDVNFSAASMKR